MNLFFQDAVYLFFAMRCTSEQRNTFFVKMGRQSFLGPEVQTLEFDMTSEGILMKP